MGTILIAVGGCGILLLILSALWPKIRGLFPSSVQAVGDRVDTAVDKAAASAALETLVLLFSERGDTETVKVLGSLWVAIWSWKPPTPAQTPAVTLADIAAQVAALAKTTNEVPVASTQGA
jgi:hypothetical protein